jgi:hypothetical protein
MSTWPPPIVDANPNLLDPRRVGLLARAAVASVDKPVRLNDACRLAQASVRVEEIRVSGRSRQAMLIPADPGFTILLNPLSRGRPSPRCWTRFVLAHELGHTFFYRPGRRPTRVHRPGVAEESFCHRFAVSLLVPAVVAERTPLTPGGLLGLGDRYEVPLFVAAMAMLHRRSHTSILWLRHRPHPRTGDCETMRVQWSAGARFFARGESLKSRLATLEPGEHAVSDEELCIAGRRERLVVEAWHLKSGSMMAVLRHNATATGAAKPAPVAQQISRREARSLPFASTADVGGLEQLTIFG